MEFSHLKWFNVMGVSDLCPHLDLTPGHELSSSIVLWLYSSSSHWMVKYSD